MGTKKKAKSKAADGEGRQKLNPAEEVELLAQVQRICPQCGCALFYKKQRRSYKHYEVAHLYPLNPTAEEIAVLAGLERLSDDVNDLDNLIPLCLSCHGKFDKPRTAEEYRALVSKKKEIISRSEQHKLQHEYQLQADVRKVVAALDAAGEGAIDPANLAFDAKPLQEKFDETMPLQTRRKIHRNVGDYFVQVRQSLQRLDRERPGTADQIAGQVRAFYLAQKQCGWSQQQIFSGVVDWIVTRAKPTTLEAAEIVASFFVQNCEVFE